MRRYLFVVAVTAAAATLTGVVPAGGASAGAAALGIRTAPGARVWVAGYDGGSDGYDAAHAMAVSPDGSRVFVTGDSYRLRATGRDYATVAYSAATGRQLWVRRYSGPGQRTDIPWAVAVSLDGSRVFVTGQSTVRPHSDAYATIAYDAATGRQLWLRRYQGPGQEFSDASALAVSPDGSKVFVTGDSVKGTSGGYATVAYSAATGRQLWVRRHIPRSGFDYGIAVAVSPDGSRVFVTGTADHATVAYSAASGRRLWVSRRSNGFGSSMAVSPDGSTVYVSGGDSAGGAGYTTVAYSAATGRQQWVSRRHKGDSGETALNPDGTTVYVNGTSGGDYLTVAYNAATGTQLWSSRYSVGTGASLALSPDGSTVYVTGSKGSDQGYATVAYNGATGRQLWASRYHGPANLGNACCVAASPDGTAVFVTGHSYGGRTDFDYATVAYRG
jgi:DNA-binding beta-propeller fold protein YncE